MKFTPQGGTISFIVDTPNDQTLIQVTDTGQGIPLCDQPYIFESYFRGSNVAEDVEGFGLGLSVVKSIVESYRGRIWVESELGRGTTFTVVLPPYSPPNGSETQAVRIQGPD